MTPMRTDVAPFEYVEAKVAFYPPGGDRTGGGQWNQMQLPLSPEESQKHFVTPEGFEVQLFAAEPDIHKPITMNWDERGWLWIAESYDYPNEKQPPGEGRDTIKICTDTDGDGRADRFTIFADHLSIPTSLTFARGGVIVHRAPQTLFLKDLDGDDVADVREVLFEGWSIADTHAGPSNLQYGFDNWIWGAQGYAGFAGEIGGELQQFNRGFYRFRPDGSQLEFLRSTNNNTWGLGFSEEGLVFGSTANRNPSVYMPIPNRYYESVRGWSAEILGGIADTHLFHPITDKIRQVDHHGGYTAAAGHALYTARTYPKPFWNRTAFVCGPTGHLVGTFVLEREGSDFHSHLPFNLLASDDEWTAPIMAEVGPDGNVWVIDWYNYIVQHNPTPIGYKTGRGNAYETDLRDKRHGRIYRVVYRGAPAYEPRSLAEASPETLVATLADDNLLWRKHAQRLLVERGETDVLPALVAMALDPHVDEIGLNVGAIHALWTLDGLGAFDGAHPEATAAAVAALEHPSAGVRLNAARVLPRGVASARALLDAGLLDDPDAQVRLAALLALADASRGAEAIHADVAAALVSFLTRQENVADRWIPDAATSAAAACDAEFLVALAAETETPPNRVLELVGTVAEHYGRGEPGDSIARVMQALAHADVRIAEAALSGLASGWPRDRSITLDDEFETSLDRLFDRLPPGAQGQLVRLASTWGSRAFQARAAQIAGTLLGAVGDESLAEAKRIEAAKQLVGFRGDDAEVIDGLLATISPRVSPELAVGLLDAVGHSESPRVGPAVVATLPRLTPAAVRQAMTVLLRRSEWTETLLTAAQQGEVDLNRLDLDQKQALAAHPNSLLAFRAMRLLEAGGSLPNADRQAVLDELMPLAERTGDPALGHEVFKQQCAKCHTHGGEGNQIGPDLTGMAVHPKSELLVHLIDPSRSVEGNYRTYSVVTTDGLIVTGLMASESRTAVELFDAEGKRQVILRENIDQLVASNKSLMPEGFEKQVPPEAIVNLLEFLTQRGKYLPLPLTRSATAVSTRPMFYARNPAGQRMAFDDWKPKTAFGVPFQLIDPAGDRVNNVILLHSTNGDFPPRMPKSVSVPCNAAAVAIHLLGGVAGWGAKGPLESGTVSMIVRLHYADGTSEDHPLRNGEQVADYIARYDVPESQFAFDLGGKQIRYLSIVPQRDAVIHEIEFVKGDDRTAPLVMAVTVETR